MTRKRKIIRAVLRTSQLFVLGFMVGDIRRTSVSMSANGFPVAAIAFHVLTGIILLIAIDLSIEYVKEMLK